MESIGARLKEIRLSKGLSLEEVHKKTKIQMDILKAIEENSLANISPIYIKGFLKIYCDFLGINYKEYIPDQKDTVNQPQVVPKQTRPVMAASEPASIKVGGASKINIKQAAVVFAVILVSVFVVIGIFKLGKFLISGIKKPASTKNVQTIIIPRPLAKPVTKAAVPKSAQKTAVLSSKVRLAVSAKDDCFIQLKVDGKTVFQRVLKRGRFENWEARDRIEFSLSNAAALTMVVNGQSIPPIGRKGQAVKNIVITREGLNTGR